MPAGGLIVAGVIGAGTAIYGAIQKDKAAKAARNNVMPKYDIPQSEFDNLSLAESQAGQGMSDASRQQLQNNASAGLAATQNAILRSGGSGNAIASAEEKYQQGINQNAIYDDQARMNNLSRLQSAYTRMSASQDKRYQIDEYAPWANRAQAIAQQLQSGQQTINSGLNTLGSAASSYAGSRAKPGTLDTGVRDTSGDVKIDQLPTYGQYGTANQNAPAPGYAPTGLQQQPIPSYPSVSGDGGGQSWNWNGYYPVQQP